MLFYFLDGQKDTKYLISSFDLFVSLHLRGIRIHLYTIQFSVLPKWERFFYSKQKVVWNCEAGVRVFTQKVSFMGKNWYPREAPFPGCQQFKTNKRFCG